MKINMIGSFIRNDPFGTEIAFANGLRNIGVEVTTWDPSRQGQLVPGGADATIVFKDHGEISYPALESAKKGGQIVIEYQPDDIRAPGIKGMMEHMRQFCDYAFTFDSTGARVAELDIGYKKAKKLLVTADPNLYYPIDVKKDIDFCFVGNYSNSVMHKSRREMVDLLKNNGFNIVCTSTFSPQEINLLYNRSKVVINHATDVGQDFGQGYGYQCRHFEAGFAKSCLLSNTLLGEELDGPDSFCQFYDEKSLLFWAEELITPMDTPLGIHNVWEQFAEQLYEDVCQDHSPEHRARDIVDFIKEVR